MILRVPNPPRPALSSASERRSAASVQPRARGACLLFALCALTTSPSGHAAEGPSGQQSSGGSFVVFGASPARAQVIGDHAERARQRAFAQLLGDERPSAWTAPCTIHVHASRGSFAAALGAPPADARGATSIEFASDRVSLRRIDLLGDGGAIVPDALDHELVHVVLADHFIHAPPPRWADEGLAILFDSAEKQQRHDADLREALARGLVWSARDLMAVEDYPLDAARQRVFYGQSAAVVRWLVELRDAATFVRFLDDIAASGIETALLRHYDIGSVASVSVAWKEVAPIHSLGFVESRDARSGSLP
jgi:hypothetical protein